MTRVISNFWLGRVLKPFKKVYPALLNSSYLSARKCRFGRSGSDRGTITAMAKAADRAGPAVVSEHPQPGTLLVKAPQDQRRHARAPRALRRALHRVRLHEDLEAGEAFLPKSRDVDRARRPRRGCSGPARRAPFAVGLGKGQLADQLEGIVDLEPALLDVRGSLRQRSGAGGNWWSGGIAGRSCHPAPKTCLGPSDAG